MFRVRNLSFVAGTLASLTIAATAFAAAPIVVTPTNTQGWYSDDTRPGGAINYVVDGGAPAGIGALQLTTDATTAAKAQYVHDTATPLTSINELSYYTKQNSASFAQGDPSYQLVVCLGGVTGTTCNGFTTFVFEPYENTTQGVVIPGAWQSWDVDSGLMWSSRTYSNGTCTVVAGAGGPPFYTLAALQSMCPNAVAVKFGVNVETDLVSFNGQAYDFEPYVAATNKGQCKDGGWMSVTRADGSSFKNQGDCVSYTNNGK
jgi:hypothetical protein